jgi:tRNA (adenine57-N1/adenine58-N1)-methyltransferase
LDHVLIFEVMVIKKLVENHEWVVLVDSDERKYLVQIKQGAEKRKGVGVFDSSTLIGKSFGTQVTIGNKSFYLLSPSLVDKLQTIRRRAQIILPRDAAQIILFCGIESGHTVVEAGIGSGSLTIALAHAVAPNGQVISYDVREDFIMHAQANIQRAQVESFVTVKQQDVGKGFKEHDVDAVVVDIPTPWKIVASSWDALKPGGYFCSYSPLTTQVQKTVEVLRDCPFIEVKTLETLQREMVVSAHGVRPSFDMLGHTGYLTFARKVIHR